MYDLVEAKKVEVIKTHRTSKAPVASIVVNDQFTHTFGERSSISQSLAFTSEQDVASTLIGGKFFFVDDQLLDYRNGQYKGFVHTDKMIATLYDKLGVRKMSHNRNTSKLAMVTDRGPQSFQVDHVGDGGQFDTYTNFMWSPFQQRLRTFVTLRRLICENQMNAVDTLVNKQIPLINHWDEHMAIAETQTHEIIRKLTCDRLESASTNNANLQQVLTLRNIAHDNQITDFDNILDLSVLSGHYDLDVLSGHRANSITRQYPSHISEFDAWNIATELLSHYTLSRESQNSLNYLANVVLFKEPNSYHNEVTPVTLSTSSDRDVAFFGR